MYKEDVICVFPCLFSLIAMAQTSSTLLSKSGGSGHPCFVTDLRRKAFSISPLSMMLAVSLALLLVVVQCLSHVQLLTTLWTIAHQAPLSVGFSRQEYWSGLPFRPPGDLPDPEIEPVFLCLLHWQAGSLPLVPLDRQFTASQSLPLLFYAWIVSNKLLSFISAT